MVMEMVMLHSPRLRAPLADVSAHCSISYLVLRVSLAAPGKGELLPAPTCRLEGMSIKDRWKLIFFQC